MEIKPSNLKIGTTLFQYSNKILEYKVIGKNELETEGHKESFYILECLSCADHENCKVAIKFNDYGDLVYSHMVNAYEEDDEYYQEHEHYRNSQYYWHTNKYHVWFLSRKEARLYIHKKNIDYYNEEITKREKAIEDYKNKIEEETDKIDAVTKD
jgi:hypothetical protein